MKIRIYRIDKDVPLPARKTARAIGLDVYAAERCELLPGKVALVPTGLINEAPPGYYFKIHIRSGFSVRNGMPRSISANSISPWAPGGTVITAKSGRSASRALLRSS